VRRYAALMKQIEPQPGGDRRSENIKGVDTQPSDREKAREQANMSPE